MTLEESRDLLAAAIRRHMEEIGDRLTTLQYLHEEFGGPTPQIAGRILRRYERSLRDALGPDLDVVYWPGWNFDLEIRRTRCPAT